MGQEQHLILLLLSLLSAGDKAEEPSAERRSEIVAQVRSECGSCHMVRS
jgi:hypothetical protein